VLPNAMMAAGIGWWDQLLRAGGEKVPSPPTPPAAPRVRAWLAALVLLNAGALLLVTRTAWLGIPGAALEMAAVGLYVLGFPRGSWRGVGGKAVLAAWGIIVIALGALLVERLFTLGNQPVAAVRFYAQAWRHLWVAGAVVWLMGMGMVALARLPNATRGGVSRAAGLAVGLALAGALLTAGVFLCTAMYTGQTQVPIMHWLLVGTAPAAAGLLVAGAVLARVGVGRQAR